MQQRQLERQHQERELRRREREMYGQLPRHHRRRGHLHYRDPSGSGYEGPFAEEVNVRYDPAEMVYRDRLLLSQDRSITAAAAAAAAAASAAPPPPPHPHR